jgi:hypothetical protein
LGRTLAAGAIAGLTLAAPGAGGALAGPYNPESLPADQIGQVGEICRSIMGLGPDERAFSDCAASLSRSAAKLDRSSDLRRAREDCLVKGLRPGDPALARCEVAATSDTGAPRRASPMAGQPHDGAPLRSYANVSWQEAHQRQRMACAALGYDPARGGFSNCVANLQATMFRARHPSS